MLPISLEWLPSLHVGNTVPGSAGCPSAAGELSSQTVRGAALPLQPMRHCPDRDPGEQGAAPAACVPVLQRVCMPGGRQCLSSLHSSPDGLWVVISAGWWWQLDEWAVEFGEIIKEPDSHSVPDNK